jgi:hypothetical protein
VPGIILLAKVYVGGIGVGMVVYACNSSYFGEKYLEGHNSRPV